MITNCTGSVELLRSTMLEMVSLLTSQTSTSVSTESFSRLGSQYLQAIWYQRFMALLFVAKGNPNRSTSVLATCGKKC